MAKVTTLSSTQPNKDQFGWDNNFGNSRPKAPTRKQNMLTIRSMSTTNLPNPVPYHIYLLPIEERLGAFWGEFHRAQLFASKEEALAEGQRSLPRGGYQVAPLYEQRFPNFWDTPTSDKVAHIF